MGIYDTIVGIAAITFVATGVASFLNDSASEFEQHLSSNELLNNAKQIQYAISSYQSNNDSFPDKDSLYQDGYVSSLAVFRFLEKEWSFDHFNEVVYLELENDDELSATECFNINENQHNIKCVASEKHFPDALKKESNSFNELEKSENFTVFIQI